MSDAPAPVPRLSRRKKVAFACFMALVPLLLAEGCLRFADLAKGQTLRAHAPDLFLYQEDPDAGYALRPGVAFQGLNPASGVHSYHINSLGFRGAEFPQPKPAGEFRVLCLGGSSTFGAFGHVSDEETWPVFLERELRRRRPAVRVINAGTPGYSLFESRAQFEGSLLALQPDLVLVYQGWNDLKVLAGIARGKGWKPRRPGPQGLWTGVLKYSVLYLTIRNRILLPMYDTEGGRRGEAGEGPPLEAVPLEAWPAWEQEVELLSATCKSRGLGLVFARELSLIKEKPASEEEARAADRALGMQRPFSKHAVVAGLSECVRRLRDHPGIRFCPLEGVEANLGTMVDHVHLRPYGNQCVAESLAKFLIDGGFVQE